MAGSMVDGQPLRAVLWGIDGTGLIVATSLLALVHFRLGNDLAAGGFLVYAPARRCGRPRCCLRLCRCVISRGRW